MARIKVNRSVRTKFGLRLPGGGIAAEVLLTLSVNDLQSYQIYKNLAWLNELPAAQAESVLFHCSNSRTWARRMVESRPFPMLETLFENAAGLWSSSVESDMQEPEIAAWQVVESRLYKLLER